MKSFNKDYNQKLMKANWLRSFGVWSTLGQGLNCQRRWTKVFPCMCVCVYSTTGVLHFGDSWLIVKCAGYKDSLESWLRPKNHARVVTDVVAAAAPVVFSLVSLYAWLGTAIRNEVLSLSALKGRLTFCSTKKG